jgi:hypothetical protein
VLFVVTQLLHSGSSGCTVVISSHELTWLQWSVLGPPKENCQRATSRAALHNFYTNKGERGLSELGDGNYAPGWPILYASCEKYLHVQSSCC